MGAPVDARLAAGRARVRSAPAGRLIGFRDRRRAHHRRPPTGRRPRMRTPTSACSAAPVSASRGAAGSAASSAAFTAGGTASTALCCGPPMRTASRRACRPSDHQSRRSTRLRCATTTSRPCGRSHRTALQTGGGGDQAGGKAVERGEQRVAVEADDHDDDLVDAGVAVALHQVESRSVSCTG